MRIAHRKETGPGHGAGRSAAVVTVTVTEAADPMAGVVPAASTMSTAGTTERNRADPRLTM